MTTVANMPVQGDSISSMKGGVKSANSNHPGFLGTGSAPNSVPAPKTAGTLGGATGAGANGTVTSSAGTLGGAQKPYKNAGTGV